MAEIKFVIQDTLDRLGITKNHVAVESKVRPNTLQEMSKGKTQAINMDTLTKILVTLNQISTEKGMGFIDIQDVIRFVPDSDKPFDSNKTL